MRTTGAVILVIGMMFVGVLGLSVASDDVEQTALNSSNTSQDVYNMTDDITEGTSNTVVQAVTWGGIAAIVLSVIGLLVFLSPRGR